MQFLFLQNLQKTKKSLGKKEAATATSQLQENEIAALRKRVDHLNSQQSEAEGKLLRYKVNRLEMENDEVSKENKFLKNDRQQLEQKLEASKQREQQLEAYSGNLLEFIANTFAARDPIDLFQSQAANSSHAATLKHWRSIFTASTANTDSCNKHCDKISAAITAMKKKHRILSK